MGLGEVGSAARERLELQDRGEAVDQGLLLEEPRPPWMSDGGTVRQRAQAGAQIRTPDLPPPSDQWCWRGDIFETVRRGTRIGSRADRTWQSCPNGPVLRKGRFSECWAHPGASRFPLRAIPKCVTTSNAALSCRRALTLLKHAYPLGARGKTGFSGLGKRCRPRGFRRFRRERAPVRQSGTGCAGYAVPMSVAEADMFWLPALFRSHAPSPEEPILPG